MTAERGRSPDCPEAILSGLGRETRLCEDRVDRAGQAGRQSGSRTPNTASQLRAVQPRVGGPPGRRRPVGGRDRRDLRHGAHHGGPPPRTPRWRARATSSRRCRRRGRRRHSARCQPSRPMPRGDRQDGRRRGRRPRSGSRAGRRPRAAGRASCPAASMVRHEILAGRRHRPTTCAGRSRAGTRAAPPARRPACSRRRRPAARRGSVST